MSLMSHLKDTDSALAGVLEKELDRQRNKLELIASENIRRNLTGRGTSWS